jgi:hypothetical protein
VQKAEDGPYLVKFLLNGSNGTPLRDMLRSVSRSLKHPTLSTRPSVVRAQPPLLTMLSHTHASSLQDAHFFLSLSILCPAGMHARLICMLACVVRHIVRETKPWWHGLCCTSNPPSGSSHIMTLYVISHC